MNPLKPDPTLLVKLGSAIVHADEMLDPVKGHHFDMKTFKALLADPEIQEWLKEMGKMALLPVKR